MNGTNDEGITPLHEAVVQSRQAMIQKPQAKGQTAIEIVELLLARGAQVNAKTLSGETPLARWAVAPRWPEDGNAQIGRLLLSHGADVNARNDLGQTPLHRAALSYADNSKVIALLLSAGASRKAKTKRGETFDELLQQTKAAKTRGFGESSFPQANSTPAQKTPPPRSPRTGSATSESTSPKSIAPNSPAVSIEIANDNLRAAWRTLQDKVNVSRKGYDSDYEPARGLWPPVARAIAQGATDFKLVAGVEQDSPLHIAAYFDDLSTVQRLVQSGLPADFKSPYDVTPLHRAAQGNAVEVAAFLLAHGADVNAKNNVGYRLWARDIPVDLESELTPLHYAARNNGERVAKLLLNFGADTAAQTTSRTTPLTLAARSNAERVVKLLLRERPAPTSQERAYGAFDAAANNAERTLALLLKGLKINAPGRQRETLLYTAAEQGADKSVAVLLTHGANVQAVGPYDTPLHAVVKSASRRYHWDNKVQTAERTINELLDHGAHIDAQDNQGRTPLCAALEVPTGTYNSWTKLSLVGLLLARGASVRLGTSGGETPLHWAVKSGGKESALLLLVHGADANAKNDLGWTPLHQAVWSNNAEVIPQLLALGADPTRLNNRGETPLALARKIDAPDAVFSALQGSSQGSITRR